MTNGNGNDKVSKLSGKDVLDNLEKWFSDDSSWDSEWRDNAKRWYQMYHGTQWTSAEEEALRDRGQPVITFNHIKPAIDSIIGSERQNRPKVSMAGRTLDDHSIAQIKTSLYNYITYNSNTDDEIDKLEKDSFITGRGWISVYPDLADKDFKDIMHKHVDYRDMFIDGLSKRDDLSDCRRLHQAVFTDEDIVKKMFPKFNKANPEIDFAFSGSSEEDMWFEKANRNRPRLISSWYKDEEGDMTLTIWVKGQVLYHKKSPYTTNKYPFIQFNIDRDLNNQPYGLVKGMVGPQQEVNKRHSKALHYLNAKQVLAEENAFKDLEKAKITLAKPDGVTILQDDALRDGRIQIIDNTPLAATHIQLLELAKDEILSVSGLNKASLGQGSEYESGRKANMAISQAQTTLVPYLNKLRIARYDLADITMRLVPDFYTDENIVRIVEPNGKYSFMPINKIRLSSDGSVEKVNDVTVDDVDIVIEDAPRGLNEREEQFNQLLTIQGQTSQPIPMDILLRYSSLKDKHQLANDLEAANQKDQQMAQIQQYAQQLEQQVKELGGTIAQKDQQIVATQTARQVDKEVNKAKEEIQAQKNQLLL